MKASKFLAQGGRLTLPGYEAAYMLWTGFDCYFQGRMPTVISEIDAELHLLAQKGASASTDDICLAHFLRGLAIKHAVTPFNETLIPAIDLVRQTPSHKKKAQLKKAAKEFAVIIPLADQLEKDHYLLPYARFESALVYQRLGDYEKAQYEAKAAEKGGALRNEPAAPKKSYSRDLILGVKLYNLRMKLDILDRLSRWDMGKNDCVRAA
jgi:hypothetical protein